MSKKNNKDQSTKRIYPPKVPATVFNNILRATATYFETTPTKLLNERHNGGGLPGNAQALHRHMAIYMLRDITGIGVDILAVRFNRSRTTILRSLALTEKRIDKEIPSYFDAVHGIKLELFELGFQKCPYCSGPVPTVSNNVKGCHRCKQHTKIDTSTGKNKGSPTPVSSPQASSPRR